MKAIENHMIDGNMGFVGIQPGIYSMGTPKTEVFSEGTSLTLSSAAAPFTALTVYGKSTQDGTPSPENPVPIVSAGDEGEINISVSDNGTQSQTLTLSTPGGLPGIPVSSGGNYTDANGQQWICDEVDFKRGKYVKRIGKCEVDGTNNKFIASGDYWNLNNDSAPGTIPILGTYISKYFDPHVFYSNNDFEFIFSTGSWMAGIFDTIEELNDFCVSKKEGGDPLIIYYIMTPIETPLSPSELAAYAALRTYSPTTVVSNDAGAWMKVGYYSNAALEKMSREALKINGGNLK